MKRGIGKKGQVTIFIIVAIFIIALVALFYAFYPQIKSTLNIGAKSPQAFIQSCIEEEMNNAVDKLSLQGGVINPEFYYDYLGDKLKYLCYTNEYSKLCTVQEPMLVETINEEIKREVTNTASECFNELKKTYQDKGYDVTLNKGPEIVGLLPDKIIMSFNNTLVLRKETPETITSFNVILNNNLYLLAEVANSIIDFETTYGSAETTFYMDWYRDLKVEKLEQTDGTTVYILTDRSNNKKFQFASRSMAWEPGYSW